MHPLSSAARGCLAALMDDFEEVQRYEVGYPANQSFDHSELLPFLNCCCNKVGDPFHDSNFRSNTHAIEREVVARFAGLIGPGTGICLGLCHLRRHRGQYVRPLYGARALSPGHGLFLPGHALQRPQNYAGPECATFRGYDSLSNHKFLVDLGITPVIQSGNPPPRTGCITASTMRRVSLPAKAERRWSTSARTRQPGIIFSGVPPEVAA